MHTPPMIGRLDVTLACLLIVQRHTSLADRAVTLDEVTDDVLAVVDDLELPPELLENLELFTDAVEDSLDRLVRALWISCEGDHDSDAEEDEPRYRALEMAESALSWIRTRVGRDNHQLAAFEALDEQITARVLGDYTDDEEDDEGDEDGADDDAELVARDLEAGW